MKSLIVKKDDDKFSTIDKNDMLKVIGNHSHLNVIENKNQIHKDGTYLLINDEFNEYSLSLTCDQDIISVDGDDATFIAVLKHNGVVCEGKYITFHANGIEQSIKTDQNGIATFVYEPQGAGLVNVIASFMLLQETFVLYDTFYYDDTSTDTTSNYFINSQSGTSISYENNKVKITCGTQNGRNMIELRTPKAPLADISGKKVRFEVDLSAVTRRMQCNIIQTINGASVTTNGEIITEDGTCYVEGDIDPTATLVRFQVIPVSSAQNDTYYLTNFKVYSI